MLTLANVPYSGIKLFYPDLPKGYQTTQLDEPIVNGGIIPITLAGSQKTIRIHHAHLENAGKSLHEYHGMSGIDLNRAGTPLVEIVSQICVQQKKPLPLLKACMH